jgi:riboflavin synthase
MFTGIVQVIGTISGRQNVGDGVSFAVNGLGSLPSIEPGDSVAINGVCQTVERCTPHEIRFTAVGETIKRTTLGQLRTGARVNIETAATVETALGGHIVQGHIDDVGTVRSFVRSGKDWLLSVHVPKDVLALIVPKGSVAIDGVSLTVIEPRPDGVITATIVPYTVENTIVKDYRNGTRVNVEADILGKYVVHFLERIRNK